MGQRIHKKGLCSIDFAHKINVFSCTWNCQEGLTNINSPFYKASRNSHSWDVKLVFKWWKRTSECFMGLTSTRLKHNWRNWISASVNIKLFFKVSAMNYLLFSQSSVSTHQFTLILFLPYNPNQNHSNMQDGDIHLQCSEQCNKARQPPKLFNVLEPQKSIFSTSTFP